MPGPNVTDQGSYDILGSFLGVATPPTTLFLGLALQVPEDYLDGVTVAGTEVGTGLGYVRQEIGVGTGNWELFSNGLIATVNDIPFPLSTAEWGVVRAYFLSDAETDGKIFFSGELPQPLTVLAGMSTVVEAGTVAVGLTTIDDAIGV